MTTVSLLYFVIEHLAYMNLDMQASMIVNARNFYKYWKQFQVCELLYERRRACCYRDFESEGVQLLYRFILLYSHSLISVPPYPTQSFIGLRDVRAITYCVSWEALL